MYRIFLKNFYLKKINLKYRKILNFVIKKSKIQKE